MTRISKIHKSMKVYVRRAVSIFLFGLSVLLPQAALSQSVMGPEYAVKVGFIYNFINFVTWPEDIFSDNSQSLTLCFISNDPKRDVIYKLDGKVIKGRKIHVVSYQDASCVAESHVIFFATKEKALIHRILNLARGLSVLTIGEVEGFTDIGGIINFFEERNRLRFKVNIDAARREGLKMSSQLLGSAQIVREEKN